MSNERSLESIRAAAMRAVAGSREAQEEIARERGGKAALLDLVVEAVREALPVISSTVPNYGTPYSPSVRLLHRGTGVDLVTLYLSSEGLFWTAEDDGAHSASSRKIIDERWNTHELVEALMEELEANVAGMKKTSGRAKDIADRVLAINTLLKASSQVR